MLNQPILEKLPIRCFVAVLTESPKTGLRVARSLLFEFANTNFYVRVPRLAELQRRGRQSHRRGHRRNARDRVAPLDLADRASVASLVAAWDGPLHILSSCISRTFAAISSSSTDFLRRIPFLDRITLRIAGFVLLMFSPTHKRSHWGQGRNP
jgi:hypothetical protein